MNKLVGEITLWGTTLWEKILRWGFNENFAGDSTDKLCWGIWWTPLGIGRTSPRTNFPWQLAEDNPVIPWWGNNLWIKSGRDVRTLQGISFQNLLGISSKTCWGYDFHSPGEALDCTWGKYCWILSYSVGSWNNLVTFFSWIYLGTLADKATRLPGQFYITPISDVTRN